MTVLFSRRTFNSRRNLFTTTAIVIIINLSTPPRIIIIIPGGRTRVITNYYIETKARPSWFRVFGEQQRQRLQRAENTYFKWLAMGKTFIHEFMTFNFYRKYCATLLRDDHDTPIYLSHSSHEPTINCCRCGSLKLFSSQRIIKVVESPSNRKCRAINN